MKNFSIAVSLLSLPVFSGTALASAEPPTERLSPEIRTHALVGATQIATPGTDRKWLPALPLLADDAAIASAPHIVAITNERVHLTRGDLVSVEGKVKRQGEFLIVRAATRPHDLVSGQVLGNELYPVGKAKFVRAGDAMAVVTNARREILSGDLLWPLSSLSPEAAVRGEKSAVMPLEALIVSTVDSGVYAAQNQIVGINKGSLDGVKEGDRLALYAAASGNYILRSQESGRMTILRVFNGVSYGLITHAVAPLRVGDRARVVQGEL